MHDLLESLRRAPRRGQTMTEYALTLAFVFMLALAGVALFAAGLGAKIAYVMDEIGNVL